MQFQFSRVLYKARESTTVVETVWKRQHASDRPLAGLKPRRCFRYTTFSDGIIADHSGGGTLEFRPDSCGSSFCGSQGCQRGASANSKSPRSCERVRIRV